VSRSGDRFADQGRNCVFETTRAQFTGTQAKSQRMRGRSGRRGGGRDRGYTSDGGEEGGVDGGSRLAGRVVVVVSPGAGERAPGSGGRRGAPGEGRREPPPRKPQHLVVLLRRFGLGLARSPQGRKRLARERERGRKGGRTSGGPSIEGRWAARGRLLRLSRVYWACRGLELQAQYSLL
jgi:hypothetical protein